MARRAFFHKTIITTGHGSNVYYFPAQRQHDVINALQSNSEKVVVEKSKWLPVEIIISSSGVFFMIEGNIRFENGDFGFDYLVNQFNPEYQSALIECYDIET